MKCCKEYKKFFAETLRLYKDYQQLLSLEYKTKPGPIKVSKFFYPSMLPHQQLIFVCIYRILETMQSACLRVGALFKYHVIHLKHPQ